MSRDTASSAAPRRDRQRVRVLIAHPGAEMYGADRVLLETARGLVESGFDVVVALPEQGALATELARSGAQVVVTPMFVLRKELLSPRNWVRLMGSLLRGLGSTWRLIRRVRPDVGYINTVVLPQWSVLLRLQRIPVIAHVHEAERSSPWPVRALLYGPLTAASAIIANSSFTASVVRSTLPFLGTRTRVVLNPVPGPAIATPLRAQPQPLRIGFLGRLSPRKGPDLVVRALATLRERGIDARLDIIGDVFRGYEWFSTELDRQIDELQLSEHVSRHGYATDVWGHLAHIDVLVVPSRVDESFGNTAVEGILAGRPVVVSDLSGLKEAISGYSSTRITPVDTPGGIVDAVSDLLTQWDAVVSATQDDATVASRRHSIQEYRRNIRQTVGDTISGQVDGDDSHSGENGGNDASRGSRARAISYRKGRTI